jgi:branched-chain amino acid transport system substrate-binding protein
MTLRIARFERDLLESAPLQLVPVVKPDLAERLAGAVVSLTDGRFARFQQVVYAGMYLNEIARLDLPQSSFTADFYLWLRSAGVSRPGAVDPTEIQFAGMIRGEFDPARPAERRDLPDGSIYRLWRVRGEFRADFDLRRFPFDRQTLMLRPIHARAASDQIIYAVDRRAMLGDQSTASGTAVLAGGEPGAAVSVPAAPGSSSAFPSVSPAAFDKLTQWRALRAEARQDVLVTRSALGNPLLVGSERIREFSGFRFEVELRRRTAATLLKSLLPLGLMTLMMFASLWYPRALVRDKVAVALASALSGAVLLAAINNQLGNVSYTTAVEYAFYVFFTLALLCTAAVLLAERLRVSGQDRAALRIEWATRLAFALIVAAATVAGWFAATT